MRKKSGPSSYGKKTDNKRPYGAEGGRKPFDKDSRPGRSGSGGKDRDDKRPYGAKSSEGGSRYDEPERAKREGDREGRPERSYKKRDDFNKEGKRFGGEGRSFDKPKFKRPYEDDGKPERGGFKKRDFDKKGDGKFGGEGRDNDKPRFRKSEEGGRPERGGFKKRDFDKKDDRKFGGEGRDNDKPRFRKSEDGGRPERGGFKKRDDNKEGKRFGSGEGRPFGKPKFKRPYEDDGKPERGGFKKRPFDKKEDRFGGEDKPRKSFSKNRSFDKGEERGGRKPAARPERPDPFADPDRKKKKVEEELPDYITEGRDIKKELAEDVEAKEKSAFKTPHKYKKNTEPAPERERPAAKSKTGRKRKFYDEDEEDEMPEDDQLMTLNKFIAHSGECSRRDAAALVKQGKVKVNGELVMDPGYRVQETDEVTLVGKKLTPQKDKVYILLNKPKGFITTTEDPQERKTVMDLVANSGVDRLYPIGRLDRNTTGLLLMTNDGDLAQKLSHPSFGVKKIYQATLDKPLTKADFDKIAEGVTLEDGVAPVDAISYLDDKKEIGLEIHSGRNRIVRRIFESLGYEVEKLDRVVYAGLTKKNLPRSKWRFLTEKEIIFLKHFKS